jgi:hypothetical protein
LLGKLERTPHSTWKNERLAEVHGWTPWKAQENIETLQQGAKGRSLALQLVWVIAYFIRNGHYLLIPVLVLLLVHGLNPVLSKPRVKTALSYLVLAQRWLVLPLHQTLASLYASL